MKRTNSFTEKSKRSESSYKRKYNWSFDLVRNKRNASLNYIEMPFLTAKSKNLTTTHC